jgi:hypothetical protein
MSWLAEGLIRYTHILHARVSSGRLRRLALQLWIAFAFVSPTHACMGGERGTTARMRLSGQICCNCKRNRPPPHPGRERWCETCRPVTHRVYMCFFLHMGWHIQFSEPDLKTTLPRELTFNTPAKIRHMYDLYGAERKLEDRQALDYAIENGRGAIWLHLNSVQYMQHSSKEDRPCQNRSRSR